MYIGGPVRGNSPAIGPKCALAYDCQNQVGNRGRMSEIFPYVRTLVLTKLGDLKIPGARFKEEEMAVQVMERISPIIREADINDIVDEVVFSSELFDYMIAAEVIIEETERFAGSYYVYDLSRYAKFRDKFLSGDPIYAAAQRIGGRYYPDVFSGYRAHIQESTAAPPDEQIEGVDDLVVPASDRVVSLNHNQVSELDGQATEVIDLVWAQNAIEGAPGLRERILGQLKAGRELIRAGEFRLYLLQVTLIETLKWLADNYAKEAIGVLAVELLKALARHLGVDL